MKRIYFYISLFFFFAASTMSAQYMWQINKDTVIKWYYQDGDEFNDTQLDREKWSTGLGWGRTVVNQDLYFTDGEDLEERNGYLRFLVNKRDYKVKLAPWEIDSAYFKKNKIVLKNDTFPFRYTAGLIWSKREYKYGYFEMRFRLPKNGKGMWPAFWLFGGSKNDEIDFFEIKCERNNYVHVDMHCPDGCDNYPGFLGLKKNWGGWVKVDNYFDEGFNTIAGEWENGYMKWYLNGRGIAYFKGELEPAMHLIANMSMAKDGGAFDPGPDETTVYPGAMDVDYIRVWTKKDPEMSRAAFSAASAPQFKKESLELAGNHSALKKKKRFVYGKKSNYANDGIFVSLLRDDKTSYLMTLQGLAGDTISVDIKNGRGEPVFTQEKFNGEFLPISMGMQSTGKYVLTIKYKDRTIQQAIDYK